MRWQAVVSSIVCVACGSSRPQSPDAAPTDATTDSVVPDAPPDAAWTCSSDSACALHQVCNVDCICAAGYVDSGGGCMWAGAPIDPGFQNAAAWQVSNGAQVLPTATGGLEPGYASWSQNAACGLGIAKQMIAMPPYARAEPFLVRLSHRSGGITPAYQMTPGFSVNGVWTAAPATHENFFSTDVVCLGEAGYGGTVELVVGPEHVTQLCPMSGTVDVDHISIESAPAGTCPAPGHTLNDDLEAGGSWTFLTNGSGSAAIVNGVGVGGSHALVLDAPAGCNDAEARALISLPVLPAASALEMTATVDTGTELRATLGYFPAVTTIAGTGVSAQARGCIPSWARGSVHELQFSISRGNCPVPAGRHAVIDNIAVVAEPACAGEVIDPGFELAAVPSIVGTAWSRVAVGGTSTYVADAVQAHSGVGLLQMRGTSPCTNAGAATWVRVPKPANGGPALTLWVNAPPSADSNLEVRIGGRAGGFEVIQPIAEQTGWVQRTVCIPSKLAGHTVQVALILIGGGGVCSTVVPEHVVSIDDVAVTTSAMCP